MGEPFIRNHHYNYIKKQAAILQHTLRTVADARIVESVRCATESGVLEQFPDASEGQKQLLAQVSGLETADEFQAYLKSLEPYLIPFPQLTDKQIRNLFPKTKKLKLPDSALADDRFLSYLGWTDPSANRLYIVYPLDGQLVGIEGRFTPTNKKSYCFLCNRYEELALFTAVSKKRPAKAPPDYYKAVGNYLCLNSQDCNGNMTELTPLEAFLCTIVR